jgi:ABC-type lipoprotein release transport system permease subunit
MAWVEGRYAARSIRRNIRRSILAIAGIAVGCMLALVMEGFNRGRDEMFARAGTYSGAGHLRIVPPSWRGSRELTLRLADGDRDLAAASANPAVIAVTPRTRSQALLAMGTRVTGVELVGVDPVREPLTNRLVRTVHEGRYLRANDSGALVIGAAIARRLGAQLDDDILASVVGPTGDIQNGMFRVVGIVHTGGDAGDQMICQVPIADMPSLTGRSGIGEVAVTLADWRRSNEIRVALSGSVAKGDDVMTWEELNPDFKGHLKQDQQSSALIRWIILLIVFLGVTSSQLAAVLERRREFAVLSALGMSGWTMVRLVLLEAATLGFLGGIVGTAIGGPLVWRLSITGIDLTRFMGSGFTFGSALVEPVLFVDFGWWVLPYMLSVALGATMVASLYPATFAARTDPAVALRVAQ